jgi:hypothetical protein
MKKWTWTLIAVAIVVLLAMFTLREHFGSYKDALADVGQTEGYTDLTKPKCPEGVEKNGRWCGKPDVPASITCPEGAILFGDDKCVPPNSMQTDAEKIAAGFVFESGTNMYKKPNIVKCPDGYKVVGTITKTCEDVNKKLVTCASGYIYNPMNDKCQPTSGQQGPVSTKDECAQEISTKQWDQVSEACKNKAVGGGTTGGSSLIPQPNSGGIANSSGLKKGNIFGPAYTGVGDNSGDGLGSGIRDYPTLLGPQPKESRMIEGAGISKPSIHTELAKPGALPSAGSTGSSEDSKFFGASRLPASSPGATSTSPGDQDMYPDFFGGAGSTAYTPSSGSSKTDPVPFLSDFSAFLK